MKESQISQCTKADFDQILTDIVDFWDSDRTRHLHLQLFLYEFGDTAYVIKSVDEVQAYLFAFIAPHSIAYCHLLGVRTAYRRQGLARQLYQHFFEVARQHGCTKARAITSPTNDRSIAFHQSLGYALLGEPNEQGIPVIANYSGPDVDRVVFERRLD
jgi:ribosomal protein S18 acetylase RimI-like enzyme